MLVGDGKTYQHLMNVKRQYGSAMEKLLIFPGNWHTLKNYQPVLMKIYYSAGLRELAKSSGYRGTTLKSLEACSNFKRTHIFLLQVWETLYREMLYAYFSNSSTKCLLDTVKCILDNGIQQKSSPEKVVERIEGLIKDSNVFPNVMEFIDEMKEKDDTWSFWANFVFSDCYSYIGLYLAIRGSNWNLRVSSLKMMAPLFAALDHDTYEKIIPNHLADIQQFPKDILQCFKDGGFTVNINGQRWHSVALDEAHEMCINKDLKAAVIHPTTSYLQKTTFFFNYRIKAYNNLLRQLFPERFIKPAQPNTLINSSKQAAQ